MTNFSRQCTRTSITTPEFVSDNWSASTIPNITGRGCACGRFRYHAMCSALRKVVVKALPR